MTRFVVSMDVRQRHSKLEWLPIDVHVSAESESAAHRKACAMVEAHGLTWIGAIAVRRSPEARSA